MKYIIGSDEVGYGAWAGPLLVVAAIVPADWKAPPGLTDSKALTWDQKEAIFNAGNHPYHWSTWVQAITIDKMGVGPALAMAHKLAIETVQDFARTQGWTDVDTIIDGNKNFGIRNARAVVKADGSVPAVSIASVLAKVQRDRLMVAEAKTYPGYSFETNMGYGGSKAHDEGLVRLGPCAIHRKSYAPIARLVRQAEEPKEMWGLFVDED